MRFTDLFVLRPVLASVVSLLIFLVGLRAFGALEVRQYPRTEDTVVTVTTTYPGASSELVKGFVTTPLQQAVAEAAGIDYLVSTSRQGVSIIEARMVLDYPAADAVAEIQAKVASQRASLPEAADDPVISATTGEATALMYLAFYSASLSTEQISDYLIRNVQPRLQAVPGVAKARSIGDKAFALRVWLDPVRLAAHGLTALDVTQALRADNHLGNVGRLKDELVAVDLSASTDLRSVDEFRAVVVSERAGAAVRLGDVARVELGAEDYDSTSWYKGQPALLMAVEQAPGVNPLTVARRVREALPDIRAELPPGLVVTIPYDASLYIEEAIREVFKTLGEAVLIVLVVIYLSLGSLRAALVPAVAVPLSLVGAGFVMLVLGYSINLLTLLAMVLAIGLVVDDAIVVVENAHRHIALGKPRIQAALDGARELGLPIVAMTTTLVAVYAPIGFMGGLVGTLFSEFAFTLAGAVLVSGVVALTLSPMLSSRVLAPPATSGRFERSVEHFFARLAEAYRRRLHGALDHPSVILVFAAVVLVSTAFLFHASQRELVPTEDQSMLFFSASAPQTATVRYHETFTRQIVDRFETVPEYRDGFFLLGSFDPATVFGGFRMDPPTLRARSQSEVQAELQQKLGEVAGFQTGVFALPSLPGGGGGLPVEFVITSDAGYAALDAVGNELLERAMASGQFAFLQGSLAFDRPMTHVVIDRERAADLGLRAEDIGRTLAALLGGQTVNRFSLDGRGYRVITEVEPEFRQNAQALNDYYVRSGSGELVPLGAVVRFEDSVEPSNRTQFQQRDSLTLQGIPAPGVSLGDALTALERLAREVFPANFSSDYAGQSRQYRQQGSALLLTFFTALLVIYLVLAAQFESWRDPLIILVSVPMSIAGAMAFIALGFASINIYTQVGLITLIGLIAKNGILIVEFANQLQAREGLAKREAMERAAAIRLRPILMTTVSMLVAVVPLLLAVGPGAVSRFHIGLVIATGLGIGTVFTLFVVPAFYVWLARDHAGARLADP